MIYNPTFYRSTDSFGMNSFTTPIDENTTEVSLKEQFLKAIEKQGPKGFMRTFVDAHDDEEDYIVTPEEFLRTRTHSLELHRQLFELFHREQETFYKRFYEEHIHKLDPEHIARQCARLAMDGEVSSEVTKNILKE